MTPILTLVLVVVFASAVSAQMPALVDREAFFGSPEIAGSRISPDGKFISFVKPYKDTLNIWVKGIDEPIEKARLLTNRTDRPISSYFWSHDAKYILFVQDKGGDENFNVYAVDPTVKPAEGSEVPPARNITDVTGVRAMINAVPRSDPDAIYVGINDRDKAWHDLYRVKISTGERTLISENHDRLQGVIFDNADKRRLAVRSAQTGDTEILAFDENGKTSKIFSCNVFETCYPVRFHKDNKRFYFLSNKGQSDLIELFLMDPTTGKIEKAAADPLGRVDLNDAIFSDRTNEMVALTFEDDRTRIYWKDKQYENDYKLIKKRIGDHDINFQSATADESKFIISATSDVDPGTVWLFDRKSKKLTKLYQIRDTLPRDSLSPMKAVRYKSSDGLEIPAYLTIPKGTNGKNLPAVLFIHGGPWGRDSWGYDTYAQFLANRGYVVLQPNFRASTGYGKKFLNAGNNEWGEKMQDDITWGKKYLVEQGIVDPDRVAIMGGSYGGYATLAGVAFTPDEYAAGVAIVAPSSLETLLQSIPPYWEAVRTLFYKRMGDPNTPEGLAQMRRQSPLFSADKIKAPLLVVQGANDPRVNQRESDQIVIALRDRNYPVEYLVAPDEGHGFARPVNNMAMIATAEKFLAKHIGGRYQESMTPEVTQRLKEIKVDPKSVVLEKPADLSAAPSVDVNGKWSVAVDAGGQVIYITLDLKQDGGGLLGTMSSEMGGGSVTDGKVSGDKLKANVNANIQGQPMSIEMNATVEGQKIAGTLLVPGIGTVPFTGKRM